MTDKEVFETIDSGAATMEAAGKDSLTRRYMVTGVEEREDSYAQLYAALSNTATLRGRTMIADRLKPKWIAPGIWEWSVEYRPEELLGEARQPKAIGEATFDFDGTGGRFTLREAFVQTAYGPDAPDHGKRINVTPDGVDGVEIVRPQLSFTISQTFSGSTITMPWLRQISLLTGTTNQQPFFGFAPGEVLNLGPSGKQPFHFTSDGTVKAGKREVTFRFAVSPNRADFDVGGITVTEKGGHDYLWVQYEEAEDDDGGGSAKGITRKPVGVYVAVVYQRVSWSTMALRDPDLHYPVAA